MRVSLAKKIAGLAADGLSMFKDFGVTATGSYGWQNISGGTRNVRYPGSDLNWEAEAGDLWLNGVVAVCLQYITDKIAEPDAVVVRKQSDGKLIPVNASPVTDLLTYANPEYRGRQLLAGLALSFKLDGNAYAVKVRGQGDIGTPRELWWVPHWRMTPLAPPDGGPTEFYLMVTPTPSGAVIRKLIPRANVVHIRNGLDPNNPRKGMSPFKAMLRGIVADNEIDAYTAITMRNVGVFGAILSPKEYTESFTTEQAEALKSAMQHNTQGDGRGSLLVPNIPFEVNFATRTPQDMALTTIGDRPQARICAAFGIDPAAVGLLSNSGGKGEKYGSMRAEARESSMEQGIIPMLSVFAEAWTQELLTDFPVSSRGTTLVEYDYSNVRDLQPDKTAEDARAVNNFKGNGLTLDELRAALGLAPCLDPEIGQKFAFQLLGAPAGTLGVPMAPGQTDITGVETPDTPPSVDDEGDK